MNTGIYEIRHTESGRRYVGSALNIAQRWYAHRSALKHGKHYNRYLQAAWNKYGATAFVFEVLETLDDPALLVTREQYWIDHLRAYGDGFNVSPTAYSILGLKRSEETKAKHREAWKRRGPIPPDVRERMNAPKRGKRRSDEHRAKIGIGVVAALKREGAMEEARRRMDHARAARTFGPLDDEHKAKISEQQRGSGNCAAKLTEADVIVIRQRLAAGDIGTHIARDFGVSKLAISKIKCGRTWRHVPEQEAA